MAESSGEKKLLDFKDIFSMGFGSAIGSGIFVLLGFGIAYTGKSVSVSLIAACVMMFFAYFSQILMVSMFPLKGGTYGQSTMLYPPIMVGINAIFLLVISTSLAVYATGSAAYIAALYPKAEPFSKVISIGIITIFFLATIRGSKFLAMIQYVMTGILVISIIVLVSNSKCCTLNFLPQWVQVYVLNPSVGRGNNMCNIPEHVLHCKVMFMQ